MLGVVPAQFGSRAGLRKRIGICRIDGSTQVPSCLRRHTRSCAHRVPIPGNSNAGLAVAGCARVRPWQTANQYDGPAGGNADRTRRNTAADGVPGRAAWHAGSEDHIRIRHQRIILERPQAAPFVLGFAAVAEPPMQERAISGRREGRADSSDSGCYMYRWLQRPCLYLASKQLPRRPQYSQGCGSGRRNMC